MNTDKQDQSAKRKTIYDGIKMTKRSADFTVALLSVLLMLLFILILAASEN